MDSLYRRGRPNSHQRNPAPRQPGSYWWNDLDGHRTYQGETCNLLRRITEHVTTGKLDPLQAVFYMPANPGAPVEHRRAHEARKIQQHQPTLNQRAGGGGRKPKV